LENPNLELGEFAIIRDKAKAACFLTGRNSFKLERLMLARRSASGGFCGSEPSVGASQREPADDRRRIEQPATMIATVAALDRLWCRTDRACEAD
jgi:hypothetical protein